MSLSTQNYLRITAYVSVETIGDISRYENKIVVYMLTNKINGKKYIGATKIGVKERLRAHYVKAGHGLIGKLPSAIRKYGMERFSIEILELADSFKECLTKEREWIGRIGPEYNMTEGGEGVLGLIFSEETRKIMSSHKKGRPATWIGRNDESFIRKKISDKLSGRKYIPTDLQKECFKINIMKLHEILRRKMICVNTNEVFNSLTDGANKFGCTTGQLSIWCSGRVKPKSGLKFRYLDEFEAENDKR